MQTRTVAELLAAKIGPSRREQNPPTYQDFYIFIFCDVFQKKVNVEILIVAQLLGPKIGPSRREQNSTYLSGF